MCIISDDFALTDLLPTVVAGILAVGQWYWNAKIKERDARIDLSKRLENLLQITIEYPILEHQSVTETWKDNIESTEEKYLRYNQFCNMLFNFLAEVYDHFHGNKQKIEAFVDVKNWIRLHRQNWEYPSEPDANVDAYSEEFRRFINSYLH